MFSRQKYQLEQKPRHEIARILMTPQRARTLPNSTVIFPNLCSPSSYLTPFCPASPPAANLCKKISPLPYWMGSHPSCYPTPLDGWFIS